MEQYIKKSDVVAEIKRIEHETNYEPFTDEVLGKRCVCRNLLSFLDTLEVKEVDLKKQVDKYSSQCLKKLQEMGDDDNDLSFLSLDNCAKYFFELGLKAQKGE